MRRRRACCELTMIAGKRWLLTALLVAVVLSPIDSLRAAAPAGYTSGAGFAGVGAPALTPLAPQAAFWTPPEPAYRIYVGADRYTEPDGYRAYDGMYRLDYAYLRDIGKLPVDSLDPRTFRMFYAGAEMAIQVTGDGDGELEPGEAVIFYGRSLDALFYDGLAPTNKYTGANVYWLTFGAAPGLRMADQDGSAAGTAPAGPPKRVHLERNSTYISAYPKLPDADHWYDFKLQVVGPTGSRDAFYTLNIQHLAANAPGGVLKANLLGQYSGAHNLRLLVNGNQVYEQPNLWSGFDPVTAQASVPSSYFVEGSNSIQVRAYNAGKTIDIVYPNWIEVTYYEDYVAQANVLAFEDDAAGARRYTVRGFSNPAIEVYDVTDVARVRRFSNTEVSGTGPQYNVSFGASTSGTSRYLAAATGGWRSPARIEEVVNQASIYTAPDLLASGFGADYIMISHAAFWPEALRLAHHRGAREFRTVLVDVQRIYDQFNGGVMSAESIREFLRYARDHWQPPAPAYVVLVGDGTSDPRDYLGGGAGAPVFIPPYLALVDPTLGETAAENRFVTLDEGDILPGMSIGRLPVNDLAQAKAMVDKIIAYERQCTCSGWNYNTVFVSDNLEGGGGNFYDYSNRIADGPANWPDGGDKLLPSAYNVQKIYLTDPNDPRGTCTQSPPTVTQCSDQLVSALNNTGALFVSYVGHGGEDWWATERVWDLTTANSPPLTNGPCLPILLPMTCYEGKFQTPGATFTSLAEGSTRLPVSGAIASLSPTGYGLASGHDWLERGVLRALLHDNVDRLGPAIDSAKRYLLAKSPGDADLVDTFVLIGDPALQPKTDYVCSQTPTAVGVESFAAQRVPGGVQVTWRLASEVDAVGYNILRQEEDGGYARVNEELIPAGRSGSGDGGSYSCLDRGAQAGQAHRYQLEVMKPGGAWQRYGPVQENAAYSGVGYLPLVLQP